MRASVFLLLTMLAMGMVVPAYAAFPAHTRHTPAVSVKTEKRSFEEFVNATIEKYNLPVPPVSDGMREGKPTLNIVSFALGASGLIAIIVAFATILTSLAAPVFLLAGIGLGVAAIITGAIGSRHRPRRGLGIAGMIMGIVALSIVLAAVILAFALLLM